jgi:lysozyme
MTVKGIDLCSLQSPKTVDWAKVKASGHQFAIFKSSQYSSTRDHTFGPGVEKAKAEGILCGAYHFAFVGADPIKQAEFFFQASEGLGSRPGELPPALDLEYRKLSGAPGGVYSNAHTVAWAQAFLSRCRELWYPQPFTAEGEVQQYRKPVLYSYSSFLKELQPELLGSGMERYPLWIAHYTNAGAPSLPKPWSGWAIHQWKGNGGRVPGVAVDCDQNVFNGDMYALESLCGMRLPADAGGDAPVLPVQRQECEGWRVPLIYPEGCGGEDV